MNERMFKRIDTVFLPVRDIERSVEWYSRNFGLEVAWKVPAAASLRLGETPLTLLKHRYPGSEEPPSPDFEFRPVTEIPFNLYTPDIAAAHRWLLEAGVEVSDIADRDGLHDFVVKDPDGNLFGVVWWSEE